MKGLKKLNELRAQAHRAQQAVTAEEDRLRNEYNGALDTLYERVEAVLDGARWTVQRTERRMGNKILRARPGWATKDALHITFMFAYEESPDRFENLMATAVEVSEPAGGEVCRFQSPPHPDVLLAVVRAYMDLMSPPER